MKLNAISIFALLLISMLFPLNNFAQDASQWNLPDGVSCSSENLYKSIQIISNLSRFFLFSARMTRTK